MITPNSAAPDAAAMSTKSAGEQCVPLPALQVGGTPPDVGDQVEFTVGATITRIEGDKAYVKPTTINGEPIAEEAAEPDADDAAMQEAQAADDQA